MLIHVRTLLKEAAIAAIDPGILDLVRKIEGAKKENGNAKRWATNWGSEGNSNLNLDDGIEF